jgi:predicted house-cleaning NTP pyrophosphatase (Maf/HAM1 superfamily)
MYTIYSVHLNCDMKIGRKFKTISEGKLVTLQNILNSSSGKLPYLVEVYKGSKLVRLFKPVRNSDTVFLRKLSAEFIESYIQSEEGF